MKKNLWFIYLSIVLPFIIHAQFNVLHTFKSAVDGKRPTYSEPVSNGSVLFGTTPNGGGWGHGAIFKCNPDGSGYTVIHEFGDTVSGGLQPHGSLILAGTTLYGMTYSGGASGYGAIYKIETDGGNFSVLHSFNGVDGGRPYGSLILAGTTLYGMSYIGGSSGYGALFKIETDGGSYSVLHSFGGSTDNGSRPYGSLILDGDTLYGMSNKGGANGLGAIFKIGAGGSSFTLLHSFAGEAGDGKSPYGSLVLDETTLYGMTYGGGANDLGVIFKIGADGGEFALLHSFTGGAGDGSKPYGSLVLEGTTLYGTTYSGGANNQGVVFKMGTDGGGFSLLHSYAGTSADGRNPYGSLVLDGTTLYGMTYGGGANDLGALFGIGSNGSDFVLLHSFDCAEGATPLGSLISDGSTFYGMTYQGGANGQGVIFKMGTDGGGFSVLHSFSGGVEDGKLPFGSLTLAGATLYGMTYEGGTNDYGTIFKIGTDGSGFALLHLFTGGAEDGKNPRGSLLLDGTTCYGMTERGGTNGYGTIFKIGTDGGGFAVLHSFAAGAVDGSSPRGSLTLAGTTLYGMTYGGGANNLGVIFKMETDGSGFAVLHSFSGGVEDGKSPVGSLTLAGATLYGMTYGGGTNDYGTIFKIGTDGSGYSLLHSFIGENFGIVGAHPWDSLLLVGTTLYGLAFDNSVIFKIMTDGSGFTVLHRFDYGNGGYEPVGTLIPVGSTLYGMTYSGGYYNKGIIFSLYLPLISGTVSCGGSPLPGVVMNGLPDNPTTDAFGYYSSMVAYNWSGTVTPTLNGCAFSPGNRVYSAVTVDQVNQDYAATLLPTYTISGVVTSAGSPLAGVVLSGLPGNPSTNASGFYTTTVSYGWTGTVTPIMTDYQFTPASRSYTTVSFDQTDQDYTGNLIRFTISGSITWNGSPLADVVMNGLPGNPTTNASGVYTTKVDIGWSGTATPTLSGYQFIPVSRDYTNVSANQGGQDYAAVVAIPSLERTALIALYNSTNGDSWSNNSGWKTPPLHTDGFAMPGTEGTWYGITISSLHVQNLNLNTNNLNGCIPPEIGNLTGLQYLFLYNNRISGAVPNEIGNLVDLIQLELRLNTLSDSIPAGIGNLVKLERLTLDNNQLTGSIPPGIGSLPNLKDLYLHNNRLNGNIPGQLGNLTALLTLSIQNNRFTGNIPASLIGLTNLVNTDIGCNALYASDPDLIAFLNSRDPDWAETQTIAPANAAASPVNSTTINLTWEAITYSGDSGGYRVSFAISPGGPYTFFQQTADKSSTSMLVTGLNPWTTYYFVISTRTDPHAAQQNTVDSEYGAEVSAATVPVFTVAFSAGSGGTLTGATNQVVGYGSNCTPVEAVPNDGYQFVNWTGTGGFVTTTDNPLTVTNVTAGMTITAHFVLLNPTGWTPAQGLQNNMIVYGKAYNGNNSAAVGDWVGAFGPGGVSDCRGIAAVQTDGNYYLTVCSNETSGEIISFKLWPLPAGPAIDGSETIEFIDDGVNNWLPLHFGPRGQNISLVNGWNWISFNVLPGDFSLNSVFGSLTGVIEQVKSQTQAAVYTGGSWTGDLADMSSIANGIMYKVKTNQAHAFNTTGTTIPFNQPLPLIAGWNWIAYLPTLTQPVEDAVNSIIAPVSQVKSQMRSVIKIGSSLYGDLIDMEPNKGYKILMNEAGVLIYPHGVDLPPEPPEGSTNSSNIRDGQADSWPLITGNQYNMVAYGKVFFEGKAVDTAGYYLVSQGPHGEKDGRSFSPIQTDGSYFSTIRGNTNGETITFKLFDSIAHRTYDVAGSLVFQSDDLTADYVLNARSLKVTAPTVGAVLYMDSTCNIAWEAYEVNLVKIELYKGGRSLYTIASSVPAGNHSYSWLIPGRMHAGNDFQVKISAVDPGVIAGDTSAAFSIFPTAYIALNSPNGGQLWQAGRSYDITWSASGINDIKIELYKGGLFYSVISESTPAAALKFTWTIPTGQPLGSNYKIKVSCIDVGVNLSDDSDNMFSITALKHTAGDFNDDGKSDLVWRYYDTGGYNCLWLVETALQGAALDDPRLDSQAVVIQAETALDNKIVGTGDFNGDGRENILWRNQLSGDNFVWLMDGADYIGLMQLPALADLSWGISGTGDFNNDGKVDLLWRNHTDGSNNVWLMNGAVKVSEVSLTGEVEQAWDIYGTGDFNNDGKVDLLWRNNAAGSNRIWFMNGTTLVRTELLSALLNQDWEIAGAGDYDGNEKPDILWRNKVNGRISVWLMDGTARIGSLALTQVTNMIWKIDN